MAGSAGNAVSSHRAIKDSPASDDVVLVKSLAGPKYLIPIERAISANNLGSRDSIRIDWRSSGELMLSPLEDSEEQRTEITIDLDGLPPGALYDHLMGAYISGVQEIVIKSKYDMKRKTRNTCIGE